MLCITFSFDNVHVASIPDKNWLNPEISLKVSRLFDGGGGCPSYLSKILEFGKLITRKGLGGVGDFLKSFLNYCVGFPLVVAAGSQLAVHLFQVVVATVFLLVVVVAVFLLGVATMVLEKVISLSRCWPLPLLVYKILDIYCYCYRFAPLLWKRKIFFYNLCLQTIIPTLK